MHAIEVPSIPQNPLALFYARIWAVSSSLGFLKYGGPNTTTTYTSYVISMCITWSSICKRPKSSSALLKWGKTNRTGTILLAYEVGVETPNDIGSLEETILAHPKTALKGHLAMQRIIGEVTGI
jgi:hypothetical protein